MAEITCTLNCPTCTKTECPFGPKWKSTWHSDVQYFIKTMGCPAHSTLETLLDSMTSLKKGEIMRGRVQTIAALKQILEWAPQLLKELEENTTEDSLISNDYPGVAWIIYHSKNLEEGMANWYRASQSQRDINVIRDLLPKNKLKGKMVVCAQANTCILECHHKTPHLYNENNCERLDLISSTFRRCNTLNHSNRCVEVKK